MTTMSLKRRILKLTDTIVCSSVGVYVLSEEQQAEIDRGDKRPEDFGVNPYRKRKPGEPLYLVVDEP
jgi:hypothetical protein